MAEKRVVLHTLMKRISMNKTKYYKKAVIAVYIIAVVLISLLFALERVQTCDYVSINGDF